ncbi:Alanine--glyoxylate aminotransferase 2-like [Toxocara canis]|uniref:Alanine--glyoxylate aminotransferase 2-like n=1 Tax=Toxocara canis TaxID=6265 RepID=A0A0B2W4X2_TOXCA|nr:Alanine--glyoxylate aminotransferase 2-like [Toxocara canis]
MDVVVQALGYFNMGATDVRTSETQPSSSPCKQLLLQKRKNVIGSKCQIFYRDDPFVVSRAFMQYLYDESGRKFIDCISNVQHVGHCHPKVLEAITRQLSLSTCNVRFVSSKLTECAEELLKTLPGLDTVLFCNSGSEANDLALRLARDFTQHHDTIVVDHAYHGHVTTTMEMSPYKFDHGCTIKQPEWVHVVPCPDVYRGMYRLDDNELHNELALCEAAHKYANEVQQVIDNLQHNGRKLAAFFSEALQSCGGQVIPPKGYFRAVAKHVRKAGGLVVMDEVQTGFGRIGSTFWAHKLNDEGFVADIVTMGKPMGNGFPVSAVVTRKEIADALGGNVEYFNTYGGNPVACAAVLGVLNVIKEDNLLTHSQRIGELFEEKFNELKAKHECIGDVRGVGLFWGIDLVRDRQSREPNTELASALILELRRQFGVLLSADGPFSNIIKIKPPLCFNESDLLCTVNSIDHALHKLTTQEKRTA